MPFHRSVFTSFVALIKTFVTMKRIISIILFIACTMLCSAQTGINVFTPEDLQPGKPCDTLRYVITYDMAYVEDTLQVPMKAAHETMLLEAGRKVTAFYSYDAFKGDSINAELLSRGATQYSALGRIPWRLYTNYPETGRSSFTEKLGLDRFVCVETVEQPQWQLCPDSSATILGYSCRLARANYKGRQWSAWYAEDIPLYYGPWKLYGLPGLILRAYDSCRHYVFDAIGIKTADKARPIYYKGDGYETVSRKDLDGLYRRYYSDPVGYMAADGKVTVRVQDQRGNAVAPPKGVPYNPIER